MEFWLLGLILATALLTLAAVWFRRERSGLETLRDELNRISGSCKDGFQESRRELQDNFTNSRMETAGYFNAQQEMSKSSFAEFMKFLQDFRDNVRQTDEKTAATLAETLLAYADRNEKKSAELIKTLDEKIRLFQESTANQLSSSRNMVDERLKAIQEENSRKLEEMKKTVIEAFPDSEMAAEYRELAKTLLKICGVSAC